MTANREDQSPDVTECSGPRSSGAGTPVAALSTLCLPSMAQRWWYLSAPALLSFATHSCFARKAGAHLPWCARSAGRPFTGWPSVSASPMAGRSRSLRFAILLRLRAQGSPSMVNPLSGSNVRRTLDLSRFALSRQSPRRALRTTTDAPSSEIPVRNAGWLAFPNRRPRVCRRDCDGELIGIC